MKHAQITIADEQGRVFMLGDMDRAPEKSPPRFDGGDGGDEDDGRTAPTLWLRCMFKRNKPSAYVDLASGYHFAFEYRVQSHKAKRSAEPGHDPGDEDPWIEITHAELMAAIIAGCS